MHVLLQPVLPATFRIVYPSRDSEALPHVGDVPHCVEVVLSVYDPVLRYGAWIATLHCAGPPENPGQPRKRIRPGLFSRKCSSAVSLSCDSKAPALSANRMYFPGVPVLLWSEATSLFDECEYVVR